MAYENVARPTGIYKFINCEHDGLTTGILYSEQNSDKITDLRSRLTICELARL